MLHGARRGLLFLPTPLLFSCLLAGLGCFLALLPSFLRLGDLLYFTISDASIITFIFIIYCW